MGSGEFISTHFIPVQFTPRTNHIQNNWFYFDNNQNLKYIIFQLSCWDESTKHPFRTITIPCGPAHLNFLESTIAPCLMEYDVSMLEANCAHPSITNQQIDGIVKAVVDGTCKNGLVMVVMASAKKSIMYMKIKKWWCTFTCFSFFYYFLFVEINIFCLLRFFSTNLKIFRKKISSGKRVPPTYPFTTNFMWL